MKTKCVIGTIIIILGIIAIGFSIYIKNEVEKGKAKIFSAQSTVYAGKSLFTLHPDTKPAEQIIADSAQSKIDWRKQEVVKNEMISNWLMGIGVVLLIIGVIIFLLGFRKDCDTPKSRKRDGLLD